MKTLISALIIGLILGFASMVMAENWYAADERSSNDYRSSVGAMISEVDGSRYTPRYTTAEMSSARPASDTRQMAQSGMTIARADSSSSQRSESSGGGNEPQIRTLSPICPCFAEDTHIITQKGIKTIAEVKPGDMVLGKDGFKKVHKNWLIEGKSADLSINGLELVGEHPFIMEDGKVKKASELKLGDKLANGVEVKSIAKISGSVKKIYDLEVEGDNYYVKDMLCVSTHKNK